MPAPKVLYRSAGVDVYYDDGIYSVLGPVPGNSRFTVADAQGDMMSFSSVERAIEHAKSLRGTGRTSTSSPSQLKPPRLRRLGVINGLTIYLVSGELVRNKTDIDFTAGGSEAAYPGYIPKNEIWLDDALHVLDRIATIFHEIVERNLMLHGGVDYDDAHDIACKREIVFRKQLIARQPTSTDLGLVRRALVPFAKEAVPTGKKPGKASRTGSSN